MCCFSMCVLRTFSLLAACIRFAGFRAWCLVDVSNSIRSLFFLHSVWFFFLVSSWPGFLYYILSRVRFAILSLVKLCVCMKRWCLPFIILFILFFVRPNWYGSINKPMWIPLNQNVFPYSTWTGWNNWETVADCVGNSWISWGRKLVVYWLKIFTRQKCTCQKDRRGCWMVLLWVNDGHWEKHRSCWLQRRLRHPVRRSVDEDVSLPGSHCC